MGFQTKQTHVLLFFLLIAKIMCLRAMNLTTTPLIPTNSSGQLESTNTSMPVSSIDPISVTEEVTLNISVTNQPNVDFIQYPILNNEQLIEIYNQSDHNHTEPESARIPKSNNLFSLQEERQDHLQPPNNHYQTHHNHQFWPHYHHNYHNHLNKDNNNIYNNNNNNNYMNKHNNYNYNVPIQYPYLSNEYNLQSRIPEIASYHSSLYKALASFSNNSPTVLSTLTKTYNSTNNNSNESDINTKIMEIFRISMEPGLHLFNMTDDSKMEDDQTFMENNTANIEHIIHKHDIFTQGYTYTVNADDCLEKGTSFCTKVRNYPDFKHLDNLVKRQYPRVELFLSEDITLPQNITQRMNIDPYEESLCKSREKIIYPEAGETTSSSWSFILNNQNYKQGVRIEECEVEGSRCNSLISLPNNYIVTCKQHYIYRSLVALTPDGKLTNDLFKMPSCCKCVLRHEDTL